MKKIRISVGTNRVDSNVTKIIEVEDSATETEINDEAWQVACDMIDYNWEEI